MTPTAILYPGIAMFFLTIGVLLSPGLARRRAVRSGSVSIKFYRTYDEGTQPERLHLLSRHVQNHFEISPLFYAGILFTYVSGSVTELAIGLAWLFVCARCVHSYIHLGSNNVSVRFFTFGTSLILLTGIWTSLLYRLVISAG